MLVDTLFHLLTGGKATVDREAFRLLEKLVVDKPEVSEDEWKGRPAKTKVSAVAT